MREIILLLITIFVVLSCFNINKGDKCKKPDFQDWKDECLVEFNSQFDSDKRVRQGTIIEYIRREIENINTEEQSDFFCKVSKSKKDWDSLVLLYHYIESESNYVINSYIFKYSNNCKVISYDSSINDIRENENCALLLELNDLRSEYTNNGLLIKTELNTKFEIENLDLFYGVSFKKIRFLFDLYPSD